MRASEEGVLVLCYRGATLVFKHCLDILHRRHHASVRAAGRKRKSKLSYRTRAVAFPSVD